MTFLKRVVLSLALTLAPAAAFAQISINITVAPPALPVYEQPPIPADGYIWTPGYWAYGDDGYYWVPGTWVMAPTPGLLWTPGYWGEHIGFYGGVNYGYGYGGSGYEGGRWEGGHFTYNTAVNNVNTSIVHNTYHTTVINNVTVNNVSYNGGSGGVAAQPSAEERAAAIERHVEATSEQQQHQHAASTNESLRASVNHGSPAVAATARPGVFEGAGVVKAKPAAERFDAGQKPGGEAAQPHSPEHNAEHNPPEHNPPEHNRDAVRPAGPNGGNQPHPAAPHPQAAPGPRPGPPHPHPAAPPHNPGEQKPEEHHEEHH